MIQIERYRDLNPQSPVAYRTYMARMKQFMSGGDDFEYFKSVIVDSATSLQLAMFFDGRYRMRLGETNAGNYEQRKVFGYVTDCMEELLSGLAELPQNVLVMAHIDEDKDENEGAIIRNPSFPGRLKKRGSAKYELYRSFTVLDDKTRQREYLIQVAKDRMYNATTCLQVPDPCASTWEALWDNWPQHLERPPLHIMMYGEQGSGKSTFGATMPQPTLVWMFDGGTKALPYYEGVKEIERSKMAIGNVEVEVETLWFGNEEDQG